MLIIALIFSTVLAIVWIGLIVLINRDDWMAAAYNKVLENLTEIDKLRLKDAVNNEKLAQYHGPSAALMKILIGGGSEKEISKLERQNVLLQEGNLKSINLLVMPGYVLLRKFENIAKSSLHRTILTRYVELYGKKSVKNRTDLLLAKLLSYPIIGIAVSLALGSLIMGTGSTTTGLIVLSVGTLLVLVLVYGLYDEVGDLANKRREAIMRQFPAVVSKLALLVTSGMIMDKAWKETAYSQGTELYNEMRKTSKELDNLVSPEVAFSGFINRCNTKETAKLASALMQNLSKGNAEIGRLLKEMAREAWLERRHTAKRDSEKANSKLMIPTMLLFITILIMLLIPIAMDFSGFGF